MEFTLRQLEFMNHLRMGGSKGSKGDHPQQLIVRGLLQCGNGGYQLTHKGYEVLHSWRSGELVPVIELAKDRGSIRRRFSRGP
jgi:hypothetical protein